MLIPYGRQSISAADLEAVRAVLLSDFLTQGPALERFERAVAEYCGAKHAIAVSNATAALHIACLAAGVGPGDRVWTTPNSFVASANCALYCGAEVDFVDIRPDTYTMDPGLLAAKLADAARVGRLPKAVIPVHFAGQACDQEEFARLSGEYGFTLIEDASHAIGAEYARARIGACAHSRMTVFSFHPVKIITTGEGGMILTNDAGLHGRLKRLRSHGITREDAEMEGPSEGPWYYQQQELGFNYRMTDIQAALGCSQLERIGAFISRRRALAAMYDEALRGLPLATPFQDPRGVSAYHLYPVRLLPGAPPREQVFRGLRARGIGVNVHYIPIPAQPHYRRLGFHPEDFPRAAAYYAGAISLPVFADMTDEQGAKVIDSLKAELLR